MLWDGGFYLKRRCSWKIHLITVSPKRKEEYYVEEMVQAHLLCGPILSPSKISQWNKTTKTTRNWNSGLEYFGHYPLQLGGLGWLRVGNLMRRNTIKSSKEQEPREIWLRELCACIFILAFLHLAKNNFKAFHQSFLPIISWFPNIRLCLANKYVLSLFWVLFLLWPLCPQCICEIFHAQSPLSSS